MTASGAALKTAPGANRCRRKFLRFYPGGFRDGDYIELERSYKWQAHERWEEQLSRREMRALLQGGAYEKIAERAVRIESRTNLLFSFEKMALRDAVRAAPGARSFATGLYELLHGKGSPQQRFDRWCEVVERLPRKQTRVLTWPLVTVFGFLAQPEQHFFLKPNVTRTAALEYGHPLSYRSRPSWEIYSNVLAFAEEVRRDLRDMRPRDMIDIQSFLWVQGSDEYEE
ncbi:MAG TPA: hypothetical protein VEC57_12455 [Candidatus Limnocylindrales bacterium]|nr:hypothetical protein [Candidatus Limnocylindrales bacterium]